MQKIILENNLYKFTIYCEITNTFLTQYTSTNYETYIKKDNFYEYVYITFTDLPKIFKVNNYYYFNTSILKRTPLSRFKK